MGCIVNGPGEMADADYGYVGSGPGRITLYKGKEVVRKNVPTAKAVDELINLIREHGDWLWVGMVLLFGHFFVPFLSWLRYKNKATLKPALRISIWISVIILIDLCYNILPALKDAHDEPLPFLSLNLFWVLTSVVGVGGICVCSYLKSFPTTKIIPIRDPRIVESLTHHEATAP